MKTKSVTFTFHAAVWLSQTLTVLLLLLSIVYICLADTDSWISSSKHITRTLVLAFDHQKISIVLSFSLFNNPLPYLQLFFSFFLMLHKGSIPCMFAYIVGVCHCDLSLSFLTSKNISRTLFGVCLLLNTLFRLFCGILICKYISRMYLVAV